ncbi:MAG: tRNA (adenosine(37)-N6)-dimethylallyltransferase MiaA [bacterium]|nr:tRNA (adenosine(37)-N6)-dimethylallyltransferase MiaA [bacterium]
MNLQKNDQKIPLLILLGPTAVGKTELAVRLAKELKTEIISADSRQFYKYMDIGTAKPSKEEQKEVRHHLIDIVLPDVKFSVADYKRETEKVILDLHAQGKIPFMSGGSGLYIRSVVDGLFQSPDPDLDFRKKMEEEALEKGNLYLYEKLKAVDKETADRLHMNDIFRITRALEVFEKTGLPISKLQKEKTEKLDYRVLMIGLNRERSELYTFIEKRVDKMIESGLVKEVENLLEQGYKKDLISMQGLGYKEIIGFLEKEYSFERAVYLLKRDTRRFAKRQMTWFRKDKRINWFDLPDKNIMEKTMELVQNTFICLLFLLIFCLNSNAEDKISNRADPVLQNNIVKREEKRKKVLTEYQKIESSEEVTRAELASVFAVELDLSSLQEKSQIIVDIGNHWAKDFIKEITAKGIMEIYSNHNFIPEQRITRAEFAYYIQEIIISFKNDFTIRNKFLNVDSPFIDISKEHVYYNPIMLAVTTGILQGTSPDEFSPQGIISGKSAVNTMQRLREYLALDNLK